jgi:hypothetical protein
MASIAPLLLAFVFSALAFAQLPSSACDADERTLVECPFLTTSASDMDGWAGRDSDSRVADRSSDGASTSAGRSGPAVSSQANMFRASSAQKKPGFHWPRALFESFMFFSIEQAYVVHDDYRWVVIENGVPFNHYWRDYKQSLSSWIHAGWNDGDPWLYSYIGHPIQGAMTSYIQIQNDPQGENLELSNTKEYWHSRLKATLWNAVYSAQWNIGPLSELTFEKYGTQARSKWGTDGKWPCRTKTCFNGVGQVDLVITPIGGLGWVLGEDWLDKNVARRIERDRRNPFLIDITRCALNPIRGGANILHGRRPWYRARDRRAVYWSRDPARGGAPEPPSASLP